MREVSQQWRCPQRQPPGASCSCTSCCPTGYRPHGAAGHRPGLGRISFAKRKRDMVCCLLSEWCVVTSFYQRAANHVSFYLLFNLRNLFYLIDADRLEQSGVGKFIGRGAADTENGYNAIHREP